MAEGVVHARFELDDSSAQATLGKLKSQLSGLNASNVHKAADGTERLSAAAHTASVMVANVATDLLRAGWSELSSHIGDAVHRLDTLKNYVPVMESLGYGAQESQASIDKMADRLSVLPTKLDDMVSTVQGLAAITGDLDEATELGLALNDMFLASGQGGEAASRAMEQFRQALAKGKPDMQDWKALTQTAPGQMKQLAETMLGAGHQANDLYEELKEGNITMDELAEAIVQLDKSGGDGFASFAEQAEAATGGIETSMQNMQNAITKGIASVGENVGRESIVDFINEIKGYINDFFAWFNEVLPGIITAVKPIISDLGLAFSAVAEWIRSALDSIDFGFLAAALQGVARAVKIIARGITGTFQAMGRDFDALAPGLNATTGAVTAAIAAFAGFKVVTALTAGFTVLAETLFASTIPGIAGLGLAISGIAAPLAIATVAVVGLIAVVSGMNADVEAARDATQKLDETSSELGRTVESTSDGIRHQGEAAQALKDDSDGAAEAIDRMREAEENLIDQIEKTNKAASEELWQMDLAQEALTNYANAADTLSDGEQAKLRDAVEEYNSHAEQQIEIVDLATGQLRLQGEEALLTKDKTIKLTDAVKENIEQEALVENMKNAYSAQQQALVELALAEENLQKARESGVGEEEAVIQYEAASKAVRDTTYAYQSYNSQLDDSYDAQAKLKDALKNTEQVLGDNGRSMDSFRTALSNAGYSVGDFANGNENELARVASYWSTMGVDVQTALDDLGITLGEKGVENVGAYATSLEDGQAKVKQAADKLSDAGTVDAVDNSRTGQASAGSYYNSMYGGVPNTKRAAQGVYGAGAIPQHDNSRSGASTSGSFASGIQSGRPKVSAAASSVSSAASNMGNGNSYQWGSHLSSNMAAGISSGIGAITAAAKSAAAAVANLLGQTVAKYGPLHYTDVWGVHLMDNIITGMQSKMTELERTSGLAALAISDNFDPNMNASFALDSKYSNTSSIDVDKLGKAIAKYSGNYTVTLDYTAGEDAYSLALDTARALQRFDLTRG